MELQLQRDPHQEPNPQVIHGRKILREAHRKQPQRPVPAPVMAQRGRPVRALFRRQKLRAAAVSVSLLLNPFKAKTIAAEYWNTGNNKRDIEPKAIVKIVHVSRP